MRLHLAPEVAAALDRGDAVVALESTLICHGFPHPEGLAVGRELEDAVRSQDATPATIAVVAGVIRVGLDDETLAELAGRDDVAKCTARALPMTCATGAWGATTVAATMAVAARVGLEVFATGGIGGVHRGGELSLDISADIAALASYPLLVVCAGAKSLLDLPRTLEALETAGVPVIGWQTDALPAFYCRDSGLKVPQRVDDTETVAAAWQVQRALGLPGGMLLCQPPPEDAALNGDEVAQWLTACHAEAAAAGVHGPELTPYILAGLRARSGGRTLRTNRRLALANAALAARLARSIIDQRTENAP